jgi:hypothetical protein
MRTVFTLRSWITLALIFWLSACSALPIEPDTEALETKIPALETEQAALKTQLALFEQPTATSTPPPIPTTRPTDTPDPLLAEPTPAPGILPRALYFLGADANGTTQVWRLDKDGVSLTQLTSENQPVQAYAVNAIGDLAYAAWTTPEGSPKLVIRPAGSLTPTILDEREAAGETIEHVRWLPDNDTVVYHRSVTGGTVTEANPFGLLGELVVANVFSGTSRVLVRSTDDPAENVTATLYTNESIEYNAGNDWRISYRVTQISPDGRYLLVNDGGGPFWLIYDLQESTLRRLDILAYSASMDPNAQTVCLTGVTGRSNYGAFQALLCADFTARAVDTYLESPAWNPFGVDYWAEDRAVVFLQWQAVNGAMGKLQVYGYDLDTPEPVLLREEAFDFAGNPAELDGAILHGLRQTMAGGMVVVAGQAEAMPEPGLALLPLDPAVQPLYVPGLGQVSQVSWGE